MAAPIGHPKWGGRAKGTPNKQTENLIEICERKGINLFEALLEIAEQAPTLELRLSAVKEAIQYIVPKRKALEHSGEIKNPYLEKSVEELEKMIKEKLGK